MLSGDTSSVTVSAQNGIGVSSGGASGLQPTTVLDIPGSQNHQQLSQLLAGNTVGAALAASSAYGVSPGGIVPRHSGMSTCVTVAATNMANAGGSRATLPGVITTLNNIVTLSRQGNITLVPTGCGTQAVNAMIGGHRVPAPSQQQQLVAINTGIANAGATLLSVSSPNVTMARLQPMSSTNIGAVMSLTAAGMVISVSQSQPGLQVSANGTHIGQTVVMPRGVTPTQRFTGAAAVQQQQTNIIDGASGNTGLTNPAQMTMPAAAIAAQQMVPNAARVCICWLLLFCFSFSRY